MEKSGRQRENPSHTWGVLAEKERFEFYLAHSGKNHLSEVCQELCVFLPLPNLRVSSNLLWYYCIWGKIRGRISYYHGTIRRTNRNTMRSSSCVARLSRSMIAWHNADVWLSGSIFLFSILLSPCFFICSCISIIPLFAQIVNCQSSQTSCYRICTICAIAIFTSIAIYGIILSEGAPVRCK